MQTAGNELLLKVKDVIIDPVIALLFAVAIIVFLWGVAQYVLSADSDDGRKTGARHMFWGALGLGIMLSVFGIMTLIINSIDKINSGGIHPDPTFLR